MTPSVPTLLPDSRCLELVTKGALVGRQQRKIRVGVKNALGVSEWGGWVECLVLVADNGVLCECQRVEADRTGCVPAGHDRVCVDLSSAHP